MTPSEIIPFIDLTSLNEKDDQKTIASLCEQAQKTGTASVCVHPKFASFCKKSYPSVPLAVVGQNFPWGEGVVSLSETLEAIEVPVDEVDMVANLDFAHKGEFDKIHNEIAFLAQKCQHRNILLKVILESGDPKNKHLIGKLSEISILSGADFIKTSTGKRGSGATLEAAEIILQKIAESKKPIGFKPSGGLKTYKDSLVYFELVEKKLGKKALTPQRFRLGASSLLRSLLTTPSHR